MQAHAIFNVGNNSVNLYLIKSATHSLLIDSGFPGTLHDLGRALREASVKIHEIGYLLVTHFHPDHAGLIQELKNQSVKFVMLDLQLPFIGKMESDSQRLLTERKYQPLTLTDNILISITQSREFLRSLDIAGAIIPTKSHSEDGIALVLDSGEAFIGDLLPEDITLQQNDGVAIQDWLNLRKAGAKKIFPGHGNVYHL